MNAPDSAKRQMDMAADLAVGLLVIGMLTQSLGMADIHRRVDDGVRPPSTVSSPKDNGSGQHTPDRSLLAAIRSASGAGA
jgi:hypothetical protein